MIKKKSVYIKLLSFLLFKTKGGVKNRFNSLVSPQEFHLQKSMELELLVARVIELLSLFKAKQKLVRIGGEGDGSYIIPSNLMKNDIFLLSGGISDNNKFEIELANNGVSGIEVDNSIDTPPKTHKKLHFIQATLGDVDGTRQVTLHRLFKKVPANKRILVKLDIEGSEINSLLGGLSLKDMKRATCIVLELHNLSSITKDSLLMELLEKISTAGFVSVFIQANNGVMCYILGGYLLPDNIEVTFLKKELTTKPNFKDIEQLKKMMAKNKDNYANVNLDHFLYKNVI